MTASYVNDVPYLPTTRAKKLELVPLVLCSLCQGILWSPVACRNCDTPYCAASNLLVLKTLQITCRFNEHGCPETLMYNDLKQHEEQCGYYLMTCNGCEAKIIKNDFQQHHTTCPLVVLKCNECASLYKRRDESEHTEARCLRVQLHQIREIIEQTKQENTSKINKVETQVQHLRDQINKTL
ncbi:unnamed protein product [Adineta ricciae]|uniref:TRAF-type domain-containing protein n=1 Tax=Adineta ricciae TaxID=249248 RepID=A0A813PM58_ADIRI|nr:unnamed protein product [Adineta ricciae]CAF1352752.1 unnamed protein product [Adineta ricciae]